MSNINDTTIPSEAREEWGNDEEIKVAEVQTYVDEKNKSWKEKKSDLYSLTIDKDSYIVIPVEGSHTVILNNKSDEATYTAAMENVSVDDTQK